MTQGNDLSTAPVSQEAASSRNGAGNLSDRVRSLRLSDKAPSGGSRSSVIPWTVCGVLVLMTVAFAYRAYMVTPVASGEPGPAATNAPSSSGTNAASSGELALEVKGYVTPVHQIQVSPKVGGQIVWLNERLQEGADFKKDEILARIEDVDYKTDYEHSKAAYESAVQRCEELKNGNRPQEITQARAELDEQKANLEQLRLDLKRTVQLASTSSAAQRDYEVAKYGHDALERRVSKLQAAYELMVEGPRKERILGAAADVAVAKADMEKAKWRLDNTAILAPASGTILKKQAEKGDLVNPSAFSNGLSASLCTMTDLSQLEIEVKVSERDMPSVYKGQLCRIVPDACVRDEEFQKKHPRGFEGVVSRIIPNADRANAAIPVRVLVKIPEGEAGVYLLPDMNATVSFMKKSSK
jgi:HlyD family secretion protein